MVFRNYSEITPKLWNRGIPKLLRNYGPGLWYSEITPKLWDWDRGTMELLRTWGTWNYGITPKLLRNYGTVEFRNYSEIMDRDYGIPKLLRNCGTGTVELWNYSEIGEPWNSENCGLL